MFVGGDNLGGWWFILWLNCLFRWISMDTKKEGQRNPPLNNLSPHTGGTGKLPLWRIGQ